MALVVGSDWSGLSPGEVDHGRRRMLVVGASAAAALILAGRLPLQQTLAALRPGLLTPAEIVRSFGRAKWDWTVELAVLHQIETDRPFALELLWAALELDLDPAVKWRRKRALRLYDLYAVATDAAGRAALARLVTARSGDVALLTRARLWVDNSRQRRARLWRAAGPDGRMLGIRLAPA
jgi:hypothetical protein